MTAPSKVSGAPRTAVRARDVLRARRFPVRAGVPVEVREDPARMRPSDVPLSYGDATRLRERTGWVPTYELDRSLREVYRDAVARVAAG